MPRPIIAGLSTSATQSPQALFAQFRNALNDLESQFARNPYVSSRLDGKEEAGLQQGDPVFRFVKGRLRIGIWDGKRYRFLTGEDLQVLQNNGTNFKGIKTGTSLVTTAPVIAMFPLQNDWGFYLRTSTNILYQVYNFDGTTLKVLTFT